MSAAEAAGGGLVEGVACDAISLPGPSGLEIRGLRLTPVAPQATLILSPALGTPAAFYVRLARSLAACGIDVIVHEQRGHGDSPVRPGSGADWGYRELLEDLALLIEHARGPAPGRRLFLGGHSLGAQLACLQAGRMQDKPAGLVVIGSGVQYHRLYRWSWRARVLLAMALFPRVSRWRGFHDGPRMRFGGREATRLITDWAHVIRTGRYEPGGDAFDYEASLAGIDLPVLMLSFARDAFAPRRVVRALAAKMPHAKLMAFEWGDAELGGAAADHFDWARRPQPVALLVAGWIKVNL